MSECIPVEEAVREWLESRGYDGLCSCDYGPDDDCGCTWLNDDFIACGYYGSVSTCYPAYFLDCRKCSKVDCDKRIKDDVLMVTSKDYCTPDYIEGASDE